MDIRSITQLFRLPSLCSLCNQYHQNNSALCSDCHKLFLKLDSGCQICALPMINTAFPLCGHCIKDKPLFDCVTASYRFEEPLRTLMHRFKYDQWLHLSSTLADIMLEEAPKNLHETDCLIPVPLHAKKLRERGFNQALELTKRLSKQLKIPYDCTVSNKIKYTSAQAGLNGEERRKNLRHSFVVKPNTYKHITIIDDLVTTGSTINELARAFKKVGTIRVDVWCCARA